MTVNTQKTVVVVGGPTGATGTLEGVNILSTFTGPTGTFPVWGQATGPTGPNGTFKTVYQLSPTGPLGRIKTVIIPGYSGSAGATTYLEDHFNNTGGVNVNLAGWVPDTTGSVAWSENTASTGHNAQVAFSTDNVVWTSATAGVYVNKTVLPSANYKITATLSDNPSTFSTPGIMIGELDTAITGYLVYHDGQSALGISVQRGSAGVFTTFYGATLTMPDGVAWGTTPHSISVSRYVMSDRVRLKVTDNTRGYTAIIDDTSGSRITAINYPGIRGHQTATIDDFVVTSVSAPNQGGSQLTVDGCRSWYVQPDSICSGGNTYIGYVTSTGAIGITRLSGGVLSASTLNASLQADDHDNPSMIVLPSGQMMALYCTHSGPDLFIRYRITTNPLSSITTWDSTIWGTEQQISTTLAPAYPKPFIFNGDSNIYVFYRAGSGTQRDHIAASTTIASLSGTPSWTLTTVIQNANNRPYCQFRMNAAGTTLFCSATTGHPGEVSSSIYGGYFALTAGALKGYDNTGTNHTLPLLPTTMTLIQGTTGGTNWNSDIIVGADGNPRVLVLRYPTDPFLNTNVFLTDIQYWFYQWNGTAWNGFQLASGQHSVYPTQSAYAGNACFDGNYDGSSNFTIYSAEWSSADSVYKLAAYSINESGQTRTKLRDISTDGSSHQWRPASPVGHSTDISLTWLEGGYTAYAGGYNATIRYST